MGKIKLDSKAFPGKDYIKMNADRGNQYMIGRDAFAVIPNDFIDKILKLYDSSLFVIEDYKVIKKPVEKKLEIEEDIFPVKETKGTKKQIKKKKKGLKFWGVNKK